MNNDICKGVSLLKWTKEETGPNGTAYLCREILEAYEATGFLTWFRNNTGSAQGVTIGRAGWPDFIVCCKALGGAFGMECKGFKANKPTKLNPNQNLTMPTIEKHMPVIVVHDPIELAKALNDAEFFKSLQDKLHSMYFVNKPKVANLAEKTLNKAKKASVKK
jgi:hypothetical protein